MTIVSRHTTYSDEVASDIISVNITSFRVSDVAVFILATVFMFVLLQVIGMSIDKVRPLIWDKTGQIKNNKAVSWLIIFAVIMICYIPYMMSYWPGGIYNDTIDSIDIALGKSAWTNQNTVLYALWWKFIFAIGSLADQGDYGGLKLMTVLQCVAISATAASFVTWLRGRGVRCRVSVLLVTIVAVMPIFPYYGISLWKETWFGLALFYYTWMWYAMSERIALISGAGKEDTSGTDPDEKNAFGLRPIGLYIISTLWIIFGRNNGLYVVLFVMIVSCVSLYRKSKRLFAEGTGCYDNGTKDPSGLKILLKRLIVVNITIILLSLLIQGAVYRAAGIKSSSPVEGLGIPLQQVAYMIGSSAVDMAADDSTSDKSLGYTEQDIRERLSMTDFEYDVITSIMPIESWILQYNPVVVDSIKFGDFFNREYFESHSGEFVKAYAGMAVKNPVLAIKGYLLSTIGFWDAYKSSSSAYICTVHTVQAQYFMSDYFNMKTDKYLSDIVGPRWYISSGALVWIMLGLCVIVGNKVKNNNPTIEGDESKLTVRSDNRCALSTGISVLTFLPAVALWLTYMLATPLSFSFRYLFGLLLCMPIYILAVLSE